MSMNLLIVAIENWIHTYKAMRNKTMLKQYHDYCSNVIEVLEQTVKNLKEVSKK